LTEQRFDAIDASFSGEDTIMTLFKRANISSIDDITYHQYSILGNKTKNEVLRVLVERLTPQIDESANGRLADLSLLRRFISLDKSDD
jgi:hypothetical protein